MNSLSRGTWRWIHAPLFRRSRVGEAEVVTDTIRIVNRLQRLDGPDLSGNSTVQDWLRDIMEMHCGVLLYRKRLGPDKTAPQIVARRNFLTALLAERPDLTGLVTVRLEGNRRFQALLGDPIAIQQHIDAARDLVTRMETALVRDAYLAGDAYSLADCFATAALARFTIHGFANWWRKTPVADYDARLKSRPGLVEAEVIDTGTERDL